MLAVSPEFDQQTVGLPGMQYVSNHLLSLSLSLGPDAGHVAYFLVHFFRGLNTPGASVC